MLEVNERSHTEGSSEHDTNLFDIIQGPRLWLD